MSAYAKTLLVIHVFGAIIGIGPTFVWPIAGPMLAASDIAKRLSILELMERVTKVLVTPVVAFLQPISGALLIFASHRNRGFFGHEWLWISVALYAVLLVIAAFDTPILGKLVRALRDGETAQAETLGAKTQRNGMILGVLTVTIMFLMVWKPGD